MWYCFGDLNPLFSIAPSRSYKVIIFVCNVIRIDRVRFSGRSAFFVFLSQITACLCLRRHGWSLCFLLSEIEEKKNENINFFPSSNKSGENIGQLLLAKQKICNIKDVLHVVGLCFFFCISCWLCFGNISFWSFFDDNASVAQRRILIAFAHWQQLGTNELHNGQIIIIIIASHGQYCDKLTLALYTLSPVFVWLSFFQFSYRCEISTNKTTNVTFRLVITFYVWQQQNVQFLPM